MTKRGWIDYALLLLPVFVVLQVIDTDRMPYWKALLICLAVGAAWGLTLRMAAVVLRRFRHGVWTLKPIDSAARAEDESG